MARRGDLETPGWDLEDATDVSSMSSESLSLMAIIHSWPLGKPITRKELLQKDEISRQYILSPRQLREVARAKGVSIPASMSLKIDKMKTDDACEKLATMIEKKTGGDKKKKTSDKFYSDISGDRKTQLDDNNDSDDDDDDDESNSCWSIGVVWGLISMGGTFMVAYWVHWILGMLVGAVGITMPAWFSCCFRGKGTWGNKLTLTWGQAFGLVFWFSSAFFAIGAFNTWFMEIYQLGYAPSDASIGGVTSYRDRAVYPFTDGYRDNSKAVEWTGVEWWWRWEQFCAAPVIPAASAATFDYTTDTVNVYACDLGPCSIAISTSSMKQALVQNPAFRDECRKQLAVMATAAGVVNFDASTAVIVQMIPDSADSAAMWIKIVFLAPISFCWGGWLLWGYWLAKVNWRRFFGKVFCCRCKN